MEHVLIVLEFIGVALLQTGNLILALFGGVLGFGILLFFLARFSRNAFNKSVGSKFDHYFTGIVGTPVHELGHAIFCLPFGHKIESINLFSFRQQNQTLGYVNHSYNPKNLWHLIGNFFIGIGPILLGSILLFFLFKFLLLNGNEVLPLLNKMVNKITELSVVEALEQVWNVVRLVFSRTNVATWQFWLFIYLGVSIATHMELSPPDIKGAAKGFLSISILLLMVQIGLNLFHVHNSFVEVLASYIITFNGVLLLSSILSFSFFIAILILLNIYTLLFKQTVFHPFA